MTARRDSFSLARRALASVDTYLRYAEAVGRVNLDTRKSGVPELVEGRKTKAAIEAAADKYGDLLSGVLNQAQPEPEPRKEER